MSRRNAVYPLIFEFRFLMFVCVPVCLSFFWQCVWPSQFLVLWQFFIFGVKHVYWETIFVTAALGTETVRRTDKQTV